MALSSPVPLTRRACTSSRFPATTPRPASCAHTGLVQLDRYRHRAIVDRRRVVSVGGVFSFVEHLDVRISQVVNAIEAVIRPHEYFEASAVGGRRNNGGGAVIGEDTFWRESRPQFIELAFKRLADQTCCQDSKFNLLSSRRSRFTGRDGPSWRSATSCWSLGWRRSHGTRSKTSRPRMPRRRWSSCSRAMASGSLLNSRRSLRVPSAPSSTSATRCCLT